MIIPSQYSIGSLLRLPAWFAVILAAGLLVTLSPASAQSWTQTAGGTYTWNTDTYWSGSFPNAVGASAILNTALAGNQTINLGQNITVGSLTLGPSSGGSTYTVNTAADTFTFDNGASEATITHADGATGNDGLNGNLVLTSGGLRLINNSTGNLFVGNNSVTSITGTGNLSLDGLISVKANTTINNVGTISAVTVGGSNGTASIDGSIGSNVTSIIVNRPSSATLTLNGNNSAFAGSVDLQAGNLRISNTNSLNANNVVNLGGGVIQPVVDTTVAGLTGSGRVFAPSNGTVILTLSGSGNYSFNTNGSTFGYSDSSTKILALKVAMTASGSQTFTDSWNYRGGVTVDSGGLVLGNANVFEGRDSGGSSFSLGTLQINGGSLSSTVANANFGTTSATTNSSSMQLNLAGGVMVINGSSVGTFTLGNTGTGAMASNFMMSGGVLKLTLASAGSFDQIIGASSGDSFTITGGVFDFGGSISDYNSTYLVFSGFSTGSVSGLGFTGYDSTNYLASLGNTGILGFTAVPEPTTTGLLLVGLLTGISVLRWKRRTI